MGVPTYREYLERFVREVQPQFLCYDNYMVEFSDDLRDAGKAALYFSNLLEVRQVAREHHLPFWNAITCNQIRKFTPVPSPANLAFQVYTTLAAGGRGVHWFKYHQDAYAYAPIDASGHKTETWRYLQTINHQIRTLGPIMNRLESTGVYFTSPPPAKSLPLLPGRIVKRVQSRASVRGTAAANSPPVMVGEFKDEHGGDYIMLVNLSLGPSVNLKLDTTRPYKTKLVVSAEDGRSGAAGRKERPMANCRAGDSGEVGVKNAYTPRLLATSTAYTCVAPCMFERKTIHFPSGVKVTFGSRL